MEDLIIKYLKNNNINDFNGFDLANEGSGDFIRKWKYDLEKPSFNPTEVKLEEAKEKKKTAINNQRDLEIKKDILHSIDNKDYYFQRDIVSQLAFINAIQSLSDVAIEDWITSDNTIVDINKADLISICNHIRLRDSQEIVQARKRKDAVELLETIEEVEAYDIIQIIE